jgi:hypothetical protein
LLRQEIIELNEHWTDGPPVPLAPDGVEAAIPGSRRFRVLEGGLSERG